MQEEDISEEFVERIWQAIQNEYGNVGYFLLINLPKSVDYYSNMEHPKQFLEDFLDPNSTEDPEFLGKVKTELSKKH